MIVEKLFSEIFGRYFLAVEQVLEVAQKGASRSEIEKIVNDFGFGETAFHLLPQLLGSEWNFLKKSDGLYFSNLEGNLKRPISQIELSWLAALVNDPRFGLFLDKQKLLELKGNLKGVEPLFDLDDFVCFDKHLDGDPFADPKYIENFGKIAKAVKGNLPISVTYEGEKLGRMKTVVFPFKLCYSQLNDKFRLLCASFNEKSKKMKRVTLNLSRISSVEFAETQNPICREQLCLLFTKPNKNPPLVVEIYRERNSLERFLLQFASFDRKTEYDVERDVYICNIFYSKEHESELLIRILSFGPTVKVTSPTSFLELIKERLKKQIRLFGG